MRILYLFSRSRTLTWNDLLIVGPKAEPWNQNKIQTCNTKMICIYEPFLILLAFPYYIFQDQTIMNEHLNLYLTNIKKRYQSGISTEHSYRGDLQTLIEALVPGVLATNEPTRIACGAPDLIITRKQIPIGYIEAKDIGKPLDSKEFKSQFDRYRKSLPNLIITDYLDFWLFINGELVTTVQIGYVRDKKLFIETDKLDRFIDIMQEFCTREGQTITSASKLSKMMAAKARLLSQVIENALNSDEENKQDSSLKAQLKAFQDVLIHDINSKEFADIYAQTIAYGMFAARLHDPTLEDFSRQEAAELIPKSNPFLRKLFQYIAGYDLDDRIKWIVDALADIFRATDVAALLKNFGKTTQQNDPMIHFYETFLSEYDPKLRKSRGVWYTPEPVVNFIVRAVDDILKTEFNLPQGLADTSKTTIEVDTDVKDKRSSTGYKREKVEVHKVQILDPAAGTGTFLAEVIKQIYKKFEGQQGIWSNYVDDHLIPRVNGFELLMASYAMAHLKLELLLKETGYVAKKEQRLRVFLTNSLEEHHPDTGTLFANWLSTEANEANYIKRDTPVMVVLGNPPYSGESQNKGDWIMHLMQDYKKEPGGKEKLKEKNPKWLNDDYVKFIRYSQYFIEKNGEGILAFINPHGFLDNPTFRGMRWNLLKAYDTIYTIDLHGNSKKKEISPNGSPDVNIFDIQQGVSINIFIKTGKKKPNELAKIYHKDLYGERDFKYNYLWQNSLKTILFQALQHKEPMYFMTKKDLKTETIYRNGFSIYNLFKLCSVGIVTARDKFTIHDTQKEVEETIREFQKLADEEAREKFKLGKDVRDWKVEYARKDLTTNYPKKGKFVKIAYRPFETKWTFYTGKSKGFHCYPRNDIMKHFLIKENIGLVFSKQIKAFNNYQHCFIVKSIFESTIVSNKTSEISYGFPLFRYETNNNELFGTDKSDNFNKNILEEFQNRIKLDYEINKTIKNNTFTPLDILDYIYAVLHSPAYREKYKEFLKIDFPRVPYPKDKDTFWALVKLGSVLRGLHLMESPVLDKFITGYPVDGSNTVTRRITRKDYELDEQSQSGRVWINDEQYFEGVPLLAWEFYIGGYQPAQKWLKDRHGRTLTFDDIQHYQKIIVALTETHRIMQEIDKIDFM